MKKNTERKEYRVCLNLNNPYHRYVEEQIQKMGENGRTGTETIIKSLYDYFHQEELRICLDNLQKNLLQEICGRNQVFVSSNKEKPVEEELHSEPETQEEQVEETSGWNVPFPGEEATSQDQEETELSPGVLDFMKAFN